LIEEQIRRVHYRFVKEKEIHVSLTQIAL
jgi:hypothetical protein